MKKTTHGREHTSEVTKEKAPRPKRARTSERLSAMDEVYGSLVMAGEQRTILYRARSAHI